MPLYFSMSQSAELKGSQITSSASLNFRIVIPPSMRVVIKNTGGAFGVDHSSILLEMSGNFQSVLIIASSIDSTQTHLLVEKTDGVIYLPNANANANEVLPDYETKGQAMTTRVVANRISGIPVFQRKIQYSRQLNLIEKIEKGGKERIVYTFTTP